MVPNAVVAKAVIYTGRKSKNKIYTAFPDFWVYELC